NPHYLATADVPEGFCAVTWASGLRRPRAIRYALGTDIKCLRVSCLIHSRPPPPPPSVSCGSLRSSTSQVRLQRRRDRDRIRRWQDPGPLGRQQRWFLFAYVQPPHALALSERNVGWLSSSCSALIEPPLPRHSVRA